MQRITNSKEDRVRFSLAMARLYKAHGLQIDQEQIAVYHEALMPSVFFEPFEHAVKESIKHDDRFPKIPRLLTLASTYRVPAPKSDLGRVALPESTLTHAQACQKMQELIDGLKRYGCEFVVDDLVKQVEGS